MVHKKKKCISDTEERGLTVVKFVIVQLVNCWTTEKNVLEKYKMINFDSISARQGNNVVYLLIHIYIYYIYTLNL